MRKLSVKATEQCFFNATIRQSRNLKGMGTRFRRNDLGDRWVDKR